MNVSKGTLRKRKISNNIEKVLTNAQYDQYILAQESTDLLNERVNTMSNSLKMSSAFRRKKMLQKRGQMKKTIENKLFTEATFNVFYESLLMDEDYKMNYEDKLYSLFEQTLTQYMNDNKVTLRDLKRRNGLLESLVTLCEEIAQDEVKEKFSKDDIINELDDEEEGNDIEISDESQEKINDEKQDVSAQIVDDVKSRVLETIEREKQIANDKETLEKEIETFTSDVTEDMSENISAGKMAGGEENVDDSSDSEEFAPEAMETNDTSAPATTPEKLEESIKFNVYNPYKKFSIKKVRKIQESTLFGNILKSVANKAVKETTLNEGQNINMDMVFMESVMMLTLVESLQSLGITNYNKRELRNFGKTLLAESRK